MPSLLVTLALLGAAGAQVVPQVDADAVVRAIAAMEPAAQQAYLAQLERRLDLANRILLPADQAAQRRQAVAAALRQPNVGWDLVRELVLETDRRERAAIVRLIRQYRVKVYETFYGDRKEYDARLDALNRVLESWGKHGSFDRQQVMVDWLIAGVNSALPNSKGPLPTEPRFDLPGNIADILAADPKRGSGDLVGPKPDPNATRTNPPLETTKEPAVPDRPAPTPPSPRSDPPSDDDLPKPPSRNEPEYAPPPRSRASVIDTSPLPPPMDPEPAQPASLPSRPAPASNPAGQSSNNGAAPIAPSPTEAPSTDAALPTSETGLPSRRPQREQKPPPSPNEADSSAPPPKQSPPPKPAADPPDENPFADEDLASLAREAVEPMRAEGPLSPPRLAPPPTIQIERRPADGTAVAPSRVAMASAAVTQPPALAAEPQQSSRRSVGALSDDHRDNRHENTGSTAALSRLRELAAVDSELIVAHATDEPLPVQVNVAQLAARVAANSLNLRTLEAELDDDNRTWSRTNLEGSLRRLRLLVEEQRHLRQFIDLVPDKDRSNVGEFESLVPVAAQLARRINDSQRAAAGDGFRGSAAERQAELDQLDRLSQTLEEMHIGR